MSRTSIDIDDELVARATAKFHLPSTRAAVELALRRPAARHRRPRCAGDDPS